MFKRPVSALALLCLLACPLFAGKSAFPLRPDDPQAVYLDEPRFGAHGDGAGDDTAALQAAIDAMEERSKFGIVYIPSGRYRISDTVHVWKGIRLIGYGAERPVFVLPANTPGYAGDEAKYMLHYVSDKPDAGEEIRDANPGTFYSALSNIDFEIGAGNSAAVGVRFHIAQHCFISHADFDIGDGLAGVDEIGNELEDCRFTGGDYGIMTHKPSPSWPVYLGDMVFEGQRKAGILSEEGGLSIVGSVFRNAPHAIYVRPDRHDEIWMEECTLENISESALSLSHGNSALMQANMENVRARNVPVLVSYKESGRERVTAPAEDYLVKTFSSGNMIPQLGAEPRIDTVFDAAPLADWPGAYASRIPALPPQESWVNVRSLGIVGDGETDVTDALRKAIADHRTLFFPMGRYRISDTLVLRPETVLIGMSPIHTQLILVDEDPTFDAPGGPKAMVEAPRGGTNIISGLGINTRAKNRRAVGVLWRAGADSLMTDVRFLGGHGTYEADGSPVPVYNNNRGGDADRTRSWDSQFHSLWITDNGGGVFKNLWTPNPYAQSGLYVSDTQTPGRVYAVSSEHHVRHEFQLRNVANWRFYSCQFEEEHGEGPHAYAIDIQDSRDLTFANTYVYRVGSTRTPVEQGIRVLDSQDIDFRGLHVYGPSKFNYDASLIDVASGIRVMARELAWLHIGNAPAAQPESKWTVQKLADGFHDAASLEVAPDGTVYFVDSERQRVWAYLPERGLARVVLDSPIGPQNIALDDSGHLLVATILGAAYSFDPAVGEKSLQALELREGAPTGGADPVLPLNLWRDSHDFFEVVAEPRPHHYVSPDGSIALPVSARYPNMNRLHAFWGGPDVTRAYGMARAQPGEPFYVQDEFGQRTFRFEANADGTLASPELIAEEGEASVAEGPDGRIYVAAGPVFVFSPEGELLDRIDVPARPTSLAFSPDGKMLYVGSRDALYAVTEQEQ